MTKKQLQTLLEDFIIKNSIQAVKKERKILIAKIDKVYKKEKGIHNWLDLREELKDQNKL